MIPPTSIPRAWDSNPSEARPESQVTETGGGTVRALAMEALAQDSRLRLTEDLLGEVLATIQVNLNRGTFSSLGHDDEIKRVLIVWKRRRRQIKGGPDHG